MATYRVPAALALFTAAGLISALIEDGVFDVISWVFLSLPLLTMAWALGRKRRAGSQR